MEILIISLIVLIWHLFFVEISIFSAINLFVIFSAFSWRYFDHQQHFFYWIFIISILIDILSLYPVGLSLFISMSVLLILSILNKFIKIFDDFNIFKFVLLYIFMFILILYLYNINFDFNLFKTPQFIFYIIINFSIAFIIYRLYKNIKKDNIIKL